MRLHDHEHFFCGLLLPHQLPKEARHQADCLRAGYFALRALNIETAFALDQSYHRATRAPSSFFDPDAGELDDNALPSLDQMAPLSRLWWWRENLHAMYPSPVRPSASAFRATLDAHLTKASSVAPPVSTLTSTAPTFPTSGPISPVAKMESMANDAELRDEATAGSSFRSENHPVLQAVKSAAVGGGLSRMWFVRHIEGRMRDVELGGNNIRDINELESLLEHSHASLLYLSLELLYPHASLDSVPTPTPPSHACGPQQPSPSASGAAAVKLHAEHAASHLGKALGMVGLLRSLALHWRHRRLYLPLQICDHYKVVPERVFQEASAGKMSSEAQDVVYQIACHAKEHLKHCQELSRQLPPVLMPAFLPALLVERLLDKLLAVQFDVFDPSLRARSPLLPISLWLRARKGSNI